MSTTRAEAARTTRKPESPDKVRWMLWFDTTTLDALAAESQATGRPRAQIVRDATAARIALDPDIVARYHAAAHRAGVPVSTLFANVLRKGCPKG